jgi:metacaspase-1
LASSRSTETSAIFHRDRLSLFTKHLVGGLSGCAGHDNDGYIRVFDLFTYVATEVRKQYPQQHPVYAATHQEDNFPVSYCVAPLRRKARMIAKSASNDLKQLTELFSALYPLGPIDQSIWERAGGDVSRIVTTQQGRTDWFRALQLLKKGGGGASIRISNLIAEALADYPHYPELKQLQQ